MALVSGFDNHLLYFLSWMSFGFGHSLIAGPKLTKYFGSYTRLFYNLFASVHIGLVFFVGWRMLDSETALNFGRPWSWVIYALGWIVLLRAARDYDLGLLSGLKQIRLGPNATLDEPTLHISGMHKHMRHPLYTGVFLLLWGGIGHELELATAVWGSLYLLVGTAYEERRLGKQFGEAYVDYRKSVPAYIPWKVFIK
ncbi:MAG: isoprenylcysteine carboxylmethyltransferase family protein [Rhodospirillales bacterium]|nr:isoprenylcysteine carboxylmethyltransferase family protein [Rhodospirillales bacterium]